jgi:hypothetical protein
MRSARGPFYRNYYLPDISLIPFLPLSFLSLFPNMANIKFYLFIQLNWQLCWLPCFIQTHTHTHIHTNSQQPLLPPVPSSKRFAFACKVISLMESACGTRKSSFLHTLYAIFLCKSLMIFSCLRSLLVICLHK